MKKLIAICIFAIGLMVALPSTASRSGSKSPPGQSFVISQFDFAPAAMLQVAVIDQTPFVVYNSINAAVMVAKEGGNVVEISVSTSLDAGYLNKDVVISKVPAYKMVNNFDLRTCLTCKVFNSQNLQAKKIQSHDPVTIRADTSI